MSRPKRDKKFQETSGNPKSSELEQLHFQSYNMVIKVAMRSKVLLGLDRSNIDSAG
jgi:hypothetical protein